jgi:hypothetical protein
MHISRQKSITSRSIKNTGALIVINGVCELSYIRVYSVLYIVFAACWLQLADEAGGGIMPPPDPGGEVGESGKCKLSVTLPGLDS